MTNSAKKRRAPCLSSINYYQIPSVSQVHSHGSMCTSAVCVLSDGAFWNAINVGTRINTRLIRDSGTRGLCRQGGGSSEEMPICTDLSWNNFNKLPCSSHTTAHGPAFCGSSSCIPSPRSLLVPNLYQPHVRHGLDPDPSSFWPLYRTTPPLASANVLLFAH